MYPDLFKGLRVKPDDLSKYDAPFDWVLWEHYQPDGDDLITGTDKR